MNRVKIFRKYSEVLMWRMGASLSMWLSLLAAGEDGGSTGQAGIILTFNLAAASIPLAR